jgi:hypothetical protein
MIHKEKTNQNKKRKYNNILHILININPNETANHYEHQVCIVLNASDMVQIVNCCYSVWGQGFATLH